jgi:hypothetical protein
MSTLSSTTTAITGAARIVVDVATSPVRVAAAVLDSPSAARRDARSKELASLRADGWRPTAVRLGTRAATVELERSGQHEQVEGATLAFAAYAARVGVAAGATVTSDARP